ncbi:MAG: sugar-binding domain-containing protein [Bulleidia sp.]|nr:sugar-binding domain-containing protein [Bulleidia sp.]
MTLLSPWGESLNRQMPLPEYPRMQLQRGSFTNLNGIWEYQITDGAEPGRNDGWKEILVPFALGSKLSGSADHLLPGQVLWYRKRFRYEAQTGHTILNFEAVDQCCTVWLNGLIAGSHEGGYTPFSFDVTNMIKDENEILVKVRDDSDQGIYAYGKQKLENGGIWYTPMEGIWQTVWLEDLPDHAVQDIKITPDYDHEAVYLRMAGTYSQVVITVFEGKKLVHRGITVDKDYTIPLKDFHPWSTEDPFLYTMYLQTEDETVKSYFGMRKFSSLKDESGHMRFALNDRPLFLSGLLDQGYTIDGLMTYPSDDAMLYELKKFKSMGFNMLRKHIKQECRRWYYLCDLLGILVMQDMPSGGHPYSTMWTSWLPTAGFRTFKDNAYEKSGRVSAESRRAYNLELDQMLDSLYNSPCIFAWVPFNESWGQFDSRKAIDHIKAYDTTRLVDGASGWHDQGGGDFRSDHCYFHTFHVPKNDGRMVLLSEFGGYTYADMHHSEPKKVYGYKKFLDRAQLNDAVMQCYQKNVLDNVPKGLAGCIYTQTADVQDECNGILTADRRVVKIDERQMRRMNEKCIRGVK